MKKNVFFGSTVIALGLLVALSPQFLFKVCSAHSNTFPLCHWTAQAELGMGMIIAALGICFIVFIDPKTQLGLTLGVLFTSIMVIGTPHALIGGCKASEMACHRVAFPALTVIGIVLLVYSIILIVFSERKMSHKEH